LTFISTEQEDISSKKWKLGYSEIVNPAKDYILKHLCTSLSDTLVRAFRYHEILQTAFFYEENPAVDVDRLSSCPSLLNNVGPYNIINLEEGNVTSWPN
jgi:hypothetical protein